MGPEIDTGSVSGMSLRSDAVSAPWFSEQSRLDMPMCCNLVCMALSVLHRMKRYHTVVQVTLLLTSALYSLAEVLGVRHLRQIAALVAVVLPPLPRFTSSTLCIEY